MKVAFVIDTINKIGGTEKATINLANALAQKKHKVTLISIYKDYFPASIQYMIDSNISIHSISKKKYLKHSLIFYRIYFYLIKPKLNKFLKEQDYDFVLYTNIKFAAYSKTKYKKILVMHSRFSYFLKSTVTKRLLDKYHTSFDKVVFLTEMDKEEYSNFYSTNNGTYIYNSIKIQDDNDYLYLKRNNSVVFLGRLNTHEKQLDRAILMFDKARKQFNKPWYFKIYGEGPALSELKHLIKKHDIKNVEFLGVETDIQKIFNEADINILTSVVEGLPMSIVEASSCKVPTISYDSSPGIQELINNNDSGYIVNLNDETQFISRLKELMSDETKRKIMGNKAKDIAKLKFSEEKISSDWEKLFNSVAQGE
ncbi:TPA: glycosyltransferase [Enterococcus faecium]